MMRALYIVALVLGLGFIITTIAFAAEVNNQRTAALFSELDSYLDDYSSEGYSYGMSDSGYQEAEDTTQMAAIVTIVFLVFFEALFVLSLMKIKTKTMKVLSIIGLALTGIMLIWAVLPAASPGSVSFDEVGLGFAAFGFVLITFSIIGTIHAFRTKA